MGTHYKKQGAIFCLLFLSGSLILSSISTAQGATLSIQMFQGEQQTRFNQPVLVAGIWHYLNITTTSDFDDLTLRLYKGITIPGGEKNETNFYEWSYQKNAPMTWSDESGYGITYIQPGLCQKTNTLYSFCIGLKDFMPNIVDYYENWTAEVSHAGTTIEATRIVVEKPKSGYSLSKPTSIIFHVDPFTVMDATGDNFFKIGNIGNIPMNVDFDTVAYPEVEINNMNQRFLPGEIITHYVTIHSKSWPPGVKNIQIQLNGSYPQAYFVDTNATVTLYTSFIIDVPLLVIYVGHSNYKIEELQGTGITFQYVEKLTMYEGETRDVTAYVSGNGAVSLQIWADEKNLSALHFYDGGMETQSPLSFTASNTSERAIKVTVRALSEGTTGVLTYQLNANGVTKTYMTLISISPPQSSSEEASSGPLSIIQLLVIGIVLLVIVYMIVTYLRHKKR